MHGKLAQGSCSPRPRFCYLTVRGSLAGVATELNYRSLALLVSLLINGSVAFYLANHQPLQAPLARTGEHIPQIVVVQLQQYPPDPIPSAMIARALQTPDTGRPARAPREEQRVPLRNQNAMALVGSSTHQRRSTHEGASTAQLLSKQDAWEMRPVTGEGGSFPPQSILERPRPKLPGESSWGRKDLLEVTFRERGWKASLARMSHATYCVHLKLLANAPQDVQARNGVTGESLRAEMYDESCH